MHKPILLAAAALATASSPLVAQEDSGRRLSTSLNGASEVPGPGDPDGRGQADIRINPGQRQLCYTVTYSGIDRPTGAHVHEAPAGRAGPIVVPLKIAPDGAISGCAAITRELAMEIIRDPADYYVNLHNPAFPAGAIRGQLHK